MRLHFVSIPVLGDSTAEAELNRFLASHRVLSVERRLVEAGTASVWAVCVAYTDGDAGAAVKKSGARVDYREVLTEQDFAAFAELRALRKTLAEQEGVPPYALFTNEQLAAMVQNKARTLADLGCIDGVGRARIEKYGQTFLSRLESLQHEPGTPGRGETGAP